MKHGLEKYSNKELLEAVIGTSTSLSKDFSIRELAKKDEDELSEMIGKNLLPILATFELAKRMMEEKAEEQKRLSNSKEIANYMTPQLRDLDHEEVWLLCMDSSFSLKKRVKISTGGLTETAMDVRQIMREAIVAKSTVIAVCHNHPSSNCYPSRNDEQLTETIEEACEIMRIYLADHVIISSATEEYYSFRDMGKI